MKLKEETTHNTLNTVCVYLVISNLIFFSLLTAPHLLDREEGQLTESVSQQV